MAFFYNVQRITLGVYEPAYIDDGSIREWVITEHDGIFFNVDAGNPLKFSINDPNEDSIGRIAMTDKNNRNDNFFEMPGFYVDQEHKEMDFGLPPQEDHFIWGIGTFLGYRVDPQALTIDIFYNNGPYGDTNYRIELIR